jgi:3-oxoadipate enol-lactonase
MCLFGSTPGLKNTNAAGWLPQIEKEGLRNFLARTIDYRFDLSVTDPGLVEWFLDEAAKNDINYLARFIGLMSSLDWSDELDRIACPTCLVIPEKEAASGVRNYSAMRERIPDVETVLIEGAAHNICDVIPERCAEIALNFAKRQVHH